MKVPIGTLSRTTWMNQAGYVVRGVKTERGWRTVMEHRLIYEAANGPIPPGHFIHHINGITADNRLENLLLVSSNSEHHRIYHAHRPKSHGERVSRANKGRPHTPEHAARIAAALRGKPKSAEHRQKISNTLKGRPLPPAQLAAFREALRRPEYRAHMSQVARDRLPTMKRDERTGQWLPAKGRE